MQAKLACVAPVETQPAKPLGGEAGGVDAVDEVEPDAGTGAVTNGLAPLHVASTIAAVIAPSVRNIVIDEGSARIDHHQAAGDVGEFLLDIA